MLGTVSFMAKLKQYSVLVACVTFFMGIVLGGFTVGSKALEETQDNGIKSNIETSEDSLDENAIFYSKIDQENRKTNKDVKAMQDIILKMQKKLKDERKEHKDEIEGLKKQIETTKQEQKSASDRLKERLDHVGGSLQSVEATIASEKVRREQTAQNSKRDPRTGSNVRASTAKFQPVYDNQEELVSVTLGGKFDRFNTPENTIPANSFVRAILLNGVDSSTSEKEGENPKPILMEIIDVADLPNGFGSNITFRLH